MTDVAVMNSLHSSRTMKMVSLV